MDGGFYGLTEPWEEKHNMAEKSIESLKGAAWTAAARALREQYPTDWLTHLRVEYEKRNLTWNPRPSSEERAEAQLHQLLAEHPHLADKVAQQAVDAAARAGTPGL